MDDSTGQLARKCLLLYGFETRDKEFLACLSFLNPQPVNLLVELSEERFQEGFLDESREWMETFFHQDANPFTHLKRPSKYFMGVQRGETSLLLYEWTTSPYRFQLLESSSAVLLRVQPVVMELDVAKGISGENATAILAKVLNLERIGQREKLPELFRLPIRLTKGTIFSNARQLQIEPVHSWTDQIIGFISDRDVCLLLFKAAEGRMAGDLPPDKYWLKQNLYEKDGKTLVYKARKE